MTKEEYIKFVKGNEEINRFVEIASQLITIQTILIKSKLCSIIGEVYSQRRNKRWLIGHNLLLV